MDTYAARVCWNVQGWVVPSGDATRLEHGNESGKTYVSREGYGHEEWLFNFQWVLEGWKYGFLQPINNSIARLRGQTIGLHVYTIGPKDWFYVARISPCHVLTEDEANKAAAAFRKRGWLRQMKEQVRQIGGKPRDLDADWLFNVRFKPNDAEILDPMEPVASHDAIRRLRRYRLVKLAGENAKVISQWPHRSGTTEQGKTGTVAKKPVAAGTMDLAHSQLQHDLYETLAKRFGKSAVIKEEDFADIKVKRDGETTVIEVKTDPRPMRAVREALGQLLEYAFGCEAKGEKVSKLVVAAPGELGEGDRLYLQHLRSKRGLPLEYVCFRQGMKDVSLA